MEIRPPRKHRAAPESRAIAEVTKEGAVSTIIDEAVDEVRTAKEDVNARGFLAKFKPQCAEFDIICIFFVKFCTKVVQMLAQL